MALSETQPAPPPRAADVYFATFGERATHL